MKRSSWNKTEIRTYDILLKSSIRNPTKSKSIKHNRQNMTKILQIYNERKGKNFPDNLFSFFHL